MKKLRHEQGYTLVELLVTIGIILIVIAAVSPNFGGWDDKRAFQNLVQSVEGHLFDMRSQALSRGTTTRMRLVNDSGNYSVLTFAAPSPVSGCSSAGSWTALYSKELDVPSGFEITGSGVGDVCFFRDGSASGAEYAIAQINGGTDIGAADITVTLATGYIDVVYETN